MANQTDEYALHKYGSDPQDLMRKITRHNIYNSVYWNRSLFGINLANLVPTAIDLTHIGGANKSNRAPTPFLCMLQKLLQLAPDEEEILVYIQQQQFKYPLVLAAFYVRFVMTPVRVYQILEELLHDYRKIVVMGTQECASSDDFVMSYVDVIVDSLLHRKDMFGINLPRLPPRPSLVETGQLQPRQSKLDTKELC